MLRGPAAKRDLYPAMTAMERPRELLSVPPLSSEAETAKADQPCALPRPCPCCGGRMLIIDTFALGCEPNYPPNATPPIVRIDTS